LRRSREAPYHEAGLIKKTAVEVNTSIFVLADLKPKSATDFNDPGHRRRRITDRLSSFSQPKRAAM